MAFLMDAATLQAALAGYRQQLDEIEQKMAELRRRLGQRSNGTKPKSASPASPAKRRTRKHRMSEEGRARIAAAQRARWAKAKRAAKKSA
jgi:hypothetical protein